MTYSRGTYSTHKNSDMEFVLAHTRSFSSEASFCISVDEENNSASICQAPFIRFVK